MKLIGDGRGKPVLLSELRPVICSFRALSADSGVSSCTSSGRPGRLFMITKPQRTLMAAGKSKAYTQWRGEYKTTDVCNAATMLPTYWCAVYEEHKFINTYRQYKSTHIYISVATGRQAGRQRQSVVSERKLFDICSTSNIIPVQTPKIHPLFFIANQFPYTIHTYMIYICTYVYNNNHASEWYIYNSIK